MSIFGTGFGQPSQQQQQQQPQQNAFGQPSSFGGTGFGAFGQGNQQPQQPQSNPMFGNLATSTPNPSGGFGAFGGAATTSAFGQPKPAFGAPGGGAGAFGTTQPSAFGSTSSGGGAFGGASTSGGAFGASGSGSGVFGQPAAQQQTTFGGGGSLFGKPGGTGGFGGGNALAPSLPTAGSSNPPYQEFQERDSSGNVSTMLHYQSISCMPAYRNSSFEELRVQDYQQGRKTANSFGTSAPTAFGQPAQQQPGGGGLFGSLSSTTGAFGQQPPAGGAFGTFGQQQQPQSSGAFGSFGQPQQQPTTGGFGAFGQPQQNQQQPATGGFGAFGQQQPQQQPTGFGAFGQQNQQNKGFGTFGQAQPNTTGFSAFGTSTGQNAGGSSLFGQSQPQQQQNPSPFGAFGQQNPQNQQPSLLKPSVFGQPSTGGGGLFGGTGSQQGSGGTDLFGQRGGQQQGGGLFGQPAGGAGAFAQPAQQPTPFGQPASTGIGPFGSTNQQPNQQQQNQQPGSGFSSLFSKPPQSGGLFGSTPTAQNQNPNQQQNPNPANPLFSGGGLFGGTQQGQQGSTNPLFSNGGGGGVFGGKQPAPTSTFSGTGLFGTANQQQQQGSLPGGLFGSTNVQQQPQQSIFGGLQQQQQRQPNLTASIDQPLPSSTTSLPPLPSLAASLSPPKKKSNIFADVAARSSPRLGLGLGSVGLNYTPPGPGSKLRGFGGSTTTTTVAKNPFALPPPELGSPGKGGSLLSPDAFSGGTKGMLGGTRQSVKKLVLDKRIEEEELHRLRTGTVNGTKTREVRFSPALGVAAREREHEPTPSSPTSPTPAQPRPASRLNDVSNVAPPYPVNSNAPLDPKEGEYWCLPSVSELQGLSFGELQAVKDFTVGRVGFGTIRFLQPVDLTAVPSIADIPGKIVTFEHVECMLYPDERLKPPAGEGLNVPARIKLDRCWAVDKSTREPIKDEKDPKHQQRLRKMKAQEGAEFVGFDMETGVWEFTVPEF